MSSPAPGIVVVDKPAGWTSHDVVGRCRRIYGTRKVGHAGTLDPMATGVLVIGIERATKILGLLAATTKLYAATMRLGQATDTDDADGHVLQAVPAGGVTNAQIRDAVVGLRGDISQVPSSVSAVKVGGQRAYALARSGQTPELAARRVQIDRFDVIAIRRLGDIVDVDVEVECSSGTYIRALARDAGSELGVGGHLIALRRNRVGRFGLREAHSLDSLAADPRLSYTLDAACLLVFARRELTAEEADATSHGRALTAAGIEGTYAATAPDGRVIALLRDDDTRTRPVVVVRPATL